MPREAVFNRLRHRPLRPRVPRAERFSALLVLAALTLVVLWVLGRGDDYDPEVRDLPLAVLEQRGPPITLYTPPLLRWQDPALGGPASDLATRVSDAATHGLFPAAVFESPWQLDGRVRRFQADNLYEKINGEAEKFLKRGFVAMDYAVLRGPDDAGTIAIELFDQGDFGGSSGVFESHVGSGRRPALRDQVSYVLTGIGVIGRVGQYFFRAAGDRENSAIKAKAEQLVTAFASLGGASPPASASLSTRPAPPGGTAVTPTQTPPVTPPVTPLTLLVDALGVTEPAVYLQAENVFQYDFANDFWFARVDRAGSGEAGEAVQAFVHEAASETQAQALLTRLLDEHQYDYTTVEAATTSDWQPHWHLLRHRFLDSLFAVARAGRYLYGVEKAPAAEPAARLMQRLDAHLATVARVPSGPSGPSVAGQR